MTRHDIIYGLVGLLLAYIAWLLLRFVVLGRSKGISDSLDFSNAASETIHSQILGGDPDKSFSSVVYDGAPTTSGSSNDRAEPHLSRISEPDASAFGFDALLEMRQTRVLLDELNARHEALRDELVEIKEAMIELRAASQVSPLYSEAVSLARRGYDVQAIAERCGISVAEAELVRSLSGDSKDGETSHA
ncbi:hypothetical protein GCM10027046_31530 [Uliginosibacterium flavum]|uniref:DUF2802 domain-containing protein n=1 Tax=Uliginosibacterium flavum TaxID=1396831 RepID=A0ABV2TR42_9RHOO